MMISQGLPPVQNFANPNAFGPPNNPQNAYTGQCFNYNQFGHIARDCLLSHRAQPQSGRSISRFLGFRGRGGQHRRNAEQLEPVKKAQITRRDRTHA